MVADEHRRYLEDVEGRCLHCRSCRCFHATSVVGSLCFGEVATLLLKGELDGLSDSLFGCNQCGLCLKRCPRAFDAKEFMFHARAVLEEADGAKCRIYDGVRPDNPNNAFVTVRKEQGVVYDDALAAGATCPHLFVPGCHMASTFPELTKQAAAYLIRHDIADGMTACCCGNPLYAAGFYREYREYLERIDGRYRACGVREILTPCPSCYDFNLRAQQEGYLAGVKITCLSDALVERGIKVNRDDFPKEYVVSIHDSCPDRKRGVFAESIRALYADFDIQELAHVRVNGLCCGCGGLVPPYSAEIADSGKRLKQRDVEQAGGDCLITTCFNCKKGLTPLMPTHQYLEDLLRSESSATSCAANARRERNEAADRRFMGKEM